MYIVWNGEQSEMYRFYDRDTLDQYLVDNYETFDRGYIDVFQADEIDLTVKVETTVTFHGIKDE